MDGLDDFSLRTRPPENGSDRHAGFYVPVISSRVANEATHLQFRAASLRYLPQRHKHFSFLCNWSQVLASSSALASCQMMLTLTLDECYCFR